MAQIDRLFSSIWHNTTTGPGTPLTGLSATITIRDKSTNTIVINNQAMTEIGLGEYDYTFATMDSTKPYSYVMNPNTTTAYVTIGFVDPRTAYLDKPLSAIIGSFITNHSSQYDFGAIDRKNLESLVETIQELEKKDLATKGDINVVKTEIINTIEGIEMPEFSEVIKSVGVARQQLTKLSEYIRKESDNEKKEMKKEYEGKISVLESTIDGIEAMFEEFKGMSEGDKKKLLESKENELKEITEFADEAIEYYKEMKNNSVDEALNKIKQSL